MSVTRHPAPSSRPAVEVVRSAISLDDTPSACADARHWTTFELARLGLGSAGLRDDAELIVSELVSNALQHGTPPIVVALSEGEGDVLVSVSDTGGPPHVFASLPPDPAAARGRGLAIVASLVTAWGIRVQEPGPGKTVWGRLRNTGS